MHGINSLDNLKSALTSKLFNFSRDRDKLDFLKILRQECESDSCIYEVDRETGLFVIDQEIESINRYYKYEPSSDDSFTPKEESELHCKLNEVIEYVKN